MTKNKLLRKNVILIYLLTILRISLSLFSALLYFFMFENIKLKNFNSYGLFLSFFVLIGLLSLITDFIFRKLLFEQCENLKEKIRIYLIKEISKNKKNDKLKYNSGFLKTLTLDNVDKYVDAKYKTKFQIFYSIFTAILSILILFYIYWAIALIAIGLLLLIIIYNKLVGNKMSNLYNKLIKHNAHFNEKILNNFKIKNFFALNNQKKLQKKIFNKNSIKLMKNKNKFINKYMSLYSPGIFFNIFSQFLIPIFTGLFIYLGYIRVEYIIPVGFISSFFINNASNLVQLIPDYFQGIKISDNYFKFKNIDVKPLTISKINNISILNFHTKFLNIKQKINLNFKKNKKYLIFGDSGIGKTTLINSILNKNKNYLGQIKFNGLDVKKISMENLNDNIVLIESKPYLFDGSILENITLYDENPDIQKVKQILQNITNQKFNLNKSINNKSLSEGQKQIINLSKILYRNVNLIISDEGFSSIDKLNRKKIYSYILSLNDKTFINISHHIKEDERKDFDEAIQIY